VRDPGVIAPSQGTATAVDGPGDVATPTNRVAGGLSLLVRGARTHWLFLVAALAGLAMRIITILAYNPAFLYPDSKEYLAYADNLALTHLPPDAVRPLGYSVYLWPLLSGPDPLRTAVIVQHALGLVCGVVIYAVLLRLGIRRWLAVVGALPILLDSYQLVIEHFVMADSLCQALAIFAFAILVWHRDRIPWWAIAAAGLLLAAGVLVRYAAVAMVIPAGLYLLLRGGNARVVLTRLAILAATFVVPIAAYAVNFHHYYNSYSVTAGGGRFLYGRVAPIADCTKFTVPDYEQILCLEGPTDQRPNTATLIWSTDSPYFHTTPPAGMTRDDIAGDFAKRAIKAQPLDFAKSVLDNFGSSLRPTRSGGGSQFWGFHENFPNVGFDTSVTTDKYGSSDPTVRSGLTGFLNGYRQVVNWPGPLEALSIVLAAAASLGLGAARRSGLRLVCAVFLLAGLAAVLPSDMLSIFTWRYHLQSLPFIPVAGVIAVAALWRGGRADPARDTPPAGG
jgi:Dolichyl-phosphate-mannose-protein mannosyltransferase